MRVASMLSIGLLCAALAAPANAGVTASGLGPAAGQAIIPIAHSCPPGSRWVAPGYVRKGKWKDGRCSTWIPYHGYSAGYSQPTMPYGYGGGYPASNYGQGQSGPVVLSAAAAAAHSARKAN